MRRIRLLLVALVLVAAPVSAQTSTPFRLSAAALIAAHGADLATTEHCLGSGRCHETNPALRLFTTSPGVFGAVKMGLAAVTVLGTVRLHKNHPKLATALNCGMMALFGGIAVHNARVGS